MSRREPSYAKPSESSPEAPAATPAGRRMLVLPATFFREDLLGELRRRYPTWTIAAEDTLLAGIAALSRDRWDSVVVCVDGAEARLPEAVAGLRRVAGTRTRLVLCCVPEGEPAARRAVPSGADDYILYPVSGSQLDEVLGLAAPLHWEGGRLRRAERGATPAELEALTRALARVGRPLETLLEALAVAVQTALRTESVVVCVGDVSVECGPRLEEPMFVCPIADADEVVGELRLGAKVRGVYTPADAEKLQGYAGLAAHLVRASRRQRRWRHLAETDALCGVLNRRAFLRRLERILAEARARRLPVTIVCFDLDDFKDYNDAYGHNVGDDILRRTAELIRAGCRRNDLVARLGGDEFAVAFFDPKGPRVAGSRHPENVIHVLDRFREALRREVFEPLGPGGRGRLTISGGLASYPWDGGDVDALLHRADQALLEAKRQGKDRIVLVGDPDLFNPRASAVPGSP